MDAAAIAATSSSGVLAILGLVFGAWTAHSERKMRAKLAAADREHEPRLASDARLFETRSQVYQELLELVLHWQIAVERRNPFVDQERPPPELPPESEFWGLRARVAAFASEEVATTFDQYNKAATAFSSAVESLGESPNHEAPMRVGQHLADCADLYWALERSIRSSLST